VGREIPEKLCKGREGLGGDGKEKGVETDFIKKTVPELYHLHRGECLYNIVLKRAIAEKLKAKLRRPTGGREKNGRGEGRVVAIS